VQRDHAAHASSRFHLDHAMHVLKHRSRNSFVLA